MYRFRFLRFTDPVSEKRNTGADEYYLENPSSACPDGGDSGRGTCPFRIFIADIFFQPDRRTVCTGDFFGCKDDGRSGDDHLFKILHFGIILYTDHCSIYRIYAFNWIYPASCKKIRNMATLLVGGIMIGYICSAVTDFVVTFAEDSDIVNLHGWSQGSFSGMSWSNVKVAALMVGITLILTFFLSKPIGAYQLGEMYAQSMGVNIRVFRVLLILLSSVFSACVTAFAGRSHSLESQFRI